MNGPVIIYLEVKYSVLFFAADDSADGSCSCAEMGWCMACVALRSGAGSLPAVEWIDLVVFFFLLGEREGRRWQESEGAKWQAGCPLAFLLVAFA